MRRMTMFVVGAALLLALAAPAFAAERILSDVFDRGTGMGVAVVQINATLYARIQYRDMDNSQSFTAPDARLHVRYFVRDPGVGRFPHFGQPNPVQPHGLGHN